MFVLTSDIYLSKSYYLQQVHQPRHLPESARLFGPDILEVLSAFTHLSRPVLISSQMTSRTVWYVVPIFWLPIATYLYLRSLLQFAMPLTPFVVNPALPLTAIASVPLHAFVKSVLCFLVGNVIWTLLEYGLHRFLFHIDEWLPDRPFFLMLHFLLHGVHHYLPMDRLVSSLFDC